MARNRQRKGNPVNGMLLLDKAEGFSSNQALQKAKHLLNAQKGGHTGSLDPIATGLLPLCFGETTKISGLFLNADKTYRVTVRLGIATETGDREGRIIEQNTVEADTKQIETVLAYYRGEFKQVPPMYSALKRNGQPLYKFARKGITLEREARPVHVYSLILEDHSSDMITLNVSCSRGFYIRSLAEDIGRDLRCGAHVVSLRRTRVGEFSLEQAVTLDQLEAVASPLQREDLLLPTDKGLAHLPEILIPENLARYVKLGQSVRATQGVTPGLVRLYAETSGFLGLAEVTEDHRLAPKRLFNS